MVATLRTGQKTYRSAKRHISVHPLDVSPFNVLVTRLGVLTRPPHPGFKWSHAFSTLSDPMTDPQPLITQAHYIESITQDIGMFSKLGSAIWGLVFGKPGWVEECESERPKALARDVRCSNEPIDELDTDIFS